MKNSKVINRHYFLQLGLMTLLISVILVAVLLYGNLVKHDEYLLQALSISPNTFLHLCALLIPYALSFAAGAMIYVVAEELIPESQAEKHSDIATIGVMIGFAIMMTLDVALG